MTLKDDPIDDDDDLSIRGALLCGGVGRYCFMVVDSFSHSEVVVSLNNTVDKK